ncbi:hypothetical protein LguiB_001639 [Lonicera macranthoides]
MSEYLPPDALTEILTRLPLKIILQCTIICKSWYSLITSPNFINAHFILSNSRKETRLLIRESVEKSRKEKYSVHWDNDAFDEYAKFSFPYSSMLTGELRIVGTCNGLVCLSDDRFGFVRTMYLWNPSIRKFVTLPNPDITYMSHGVYSNSFGFGFDAATNDYKIVRIVYIEKGVFSDRLEVELYELGTGSWRRITGGNFPYVILHCSPQAFLNAVVHWFGYDRAQGGDLLIVTFHMRNEALGVLKFPLSVQFEKDWEIRLGLGVYGESLSLIHKPRNDDSCNIWMMKDYGIAESWTKQFTINLTKFDLWRPSYFRENGDILLVKSNGYLHLGFGCGGNLLSYDPRSKQIKNVDGQTVVSSVGPYMECLVLIESLNRVSGRHQNFFGSVTSKGALLLPKLTLDSTSRFTLLLSQ